MVNRKYISMLFAFATTCFVAGTVFAAPGKFTVQADELDYDMKTGVAVGKGHVVLIQDNAKATANNATYNSKTKSGVLSGNVVADRGTEHISCDEFKIENDDVFSAVGNAILSKEGKKLFAPRVDYIKSRDYAETFGNWARLMDSDGSTLSAVKIIYDGKSGVATASGGVNINSDARKLTGSADKAIYDTKKDGYVEMIGNATATQDGNTVKGDKLRLTNSNVAVGDGNVHITYIPQQEPQKEAKSLGKKEIAVINKENMVGKA